MFFVAAAVSLCYNGVENKTKEGSAHVHCPNDAGNICRYEKYRTRRTDGNNPFHDEREGFACVKNAGGCVSKKIIEKDS